MEKQDKYKKIMSGLESVRLPRTPVTTIVEMKDGSILHGFFVVSPNELMYGSHVLHFVPLAKELSYWAAVYEPIDRSDIKSNLANIDSNCINIDVEDIKSIVVRNDRNGRHIYDLSL